MTRRHLAPATHSRGPTRGSIRPQLETLEDRLAPAAGLGDLVTTSAYDPTQVLVQFEAGFNPVGLLPQGARLGEALPLAENLYVVDLTDGWTVSRMLDALRNNPHVLLAQPDYLVSIDQTPNDPSFGVQWGLHNTGQSGGTIDADIDAPAAWDVTTGTGQVIVAVLDTGIDYTHPDLQGNLWVNAGEIAGNGIDDEGDGYIDDVYGYNFVANNGNPMDDNSHGTHVAGTIGAVGNNGIGVAGVAWNVKLMALKFLDASGSGSTSNAILALNFAVSHGARISNNSWGGGGFNTALNNAIASARSQGHIFVAAAGNNGSDNDATPFYPASYDQDNVVVVAATDRYDNLASFSNYGATSVDVAAPGFSIYSTIPVGMGSYGYKSGTSMATPHVAGALALVLGQHPTWTHQQAIAHLLGTVDPVASLTGKVATGGRLNVAAAVAGASLPSLTISNVTQGEGNAATTPFTFTVTLSAASMQTVTVNYATANGTATAGSDYQSLAGTLTFNPGETTKVVTVLVNGDLAVEANEAFAVNLSGAVNATLATGQGTGTILNDDSAPITVSIGNATVIEGHGGTVAAVFTVTLSAASGTTVTVDYATANGTGLAGSDYLAGSGTVTFAPGETSKTVTVAVLGDTAIEANDTFFVNLSNAVNGGIAAGQGVGTIGNDDTTIAIGHVTRPLNASGGTDFVFTVTLAQASAVPVTVRFATANGTLKSPGGYNATSGTLTFQPGETSLTVTVRVKKGSVGQYFHVNLSGPTGATLAVSQARGTIGSGTTALATGTPPATPGSAGAGDFWSYSANDIVAALRLNERNDKGQFGI